MATGRLLSRSVIRLSCSSSSGHSNHTNSPSSWMRERDSDNGGKRLPPVSLPLLAGNQKSKISAVQSPPLISLASNQVVVDDVLSLPSLWADVLTALVSIARLAQFPKPTAAQLQMSIERGVVDCRFFTLLAVGGSLLGSILCFVEGCYMVLKSYLKYFHALSHRLDMGGVVHLLIEAIDMFLVGTAMIIFGMGLYTMFVGPQSSKRSHQPQLPHSNLFGLFSLKTKPSWIELDSLSQAKSRIGHAVMMILQVGVLEKFKSIPLVTGLDLACFAGAVVFSSASIFVLSKLSVIGLK